MFKNLNLNRLSVRLTLAFLVASIFGVALVAALAYHSTTNNLNTFINTMGMMQGTGGMMGDRWVNNVSPASTDFTNNLGRTLWVAGILGVLVALILGVIFTRYIVAPLGQVATAARRVAKGDFKQRVNVQGSGEFQELGESFNTMAQTLSRDQEMRQNMVADIAHELRTPLSVLQANVEAMQDGVLETSGENLGILHQETLVLSRLIEDLRTLTLAESGQLKFNYRDTDLKGLFSRVVEGFRPTFASKNVGLVLEAADNLPKLQVDPDRIEQVLRNLINNSLLYTPEGGVVTAKISLDAQGITASVSDTGVGIPPEDLGRIFDRFYRVDRSRNRTTGGSGLGLAIVKQLVEAHGGRAWATSQPGRGSAFFFTLPAAVRV